MFTFNLLIVSSKEGLTRKAVLPDAQYARLTTSKAMDLSVQQISYLRLVTGVPMIPTAAEHLNHISNSSVL